MASRWELRLQFLTGPLSVAPPALVLGSELPLGRRPAGKGISLAAYADIEDEHAWLAIEETGAVSLRAVGGAAVRVAPERFMDWRRRSPIEEPVPLSPGDVVHLGPPETGVSFVFLGAAPVDEGPAEEDPTAASTRRPSGRSVWRGRGLPLLVLLGLVTGFVVLSMGLFESALAPGPEVLQAR